MSEKVSFNKTVELLEVIGNLIDSTRTTSPKAQEPLKELFKQYFAQLTKQYADWKKYQFTENVGWRVCELLGDQTPITYRTFNRRISTPFKRLCLLGMCSKTENTQDYTSKFFDKLNHLFFVEKYEIAKEDLEVLEGNYVICDFKLQVIKHFRELVELG